MVAQDDENSLIEDALILEGADQPAELSVDAESP